MKRCPKCQRTYPDDSPGFCVNDGAQLVAEEAQAYDPQKTIMASQPPPPPPPPQQYNAAPPPVNQPPQQAPWPPPPPQQQQQGQWGGGYYPQPGQPGQPPSPGYAPHYGAPVGHGKALSLTAFLLGLISVLSLTLIFLMSQQVIDQDDTVAEICFYGSAALGLIAVIVAALALISRRQRSKWMAIVGLILGLPAIAFFIYVMVNYGAFV